MTIYHDYPMTAKSFAMALLNDPYAVHVVSKAMRDDKGIAAIIDAAVVNGFVRLTTDHEDISFAFHGVVAVR